VDLMDQYFNDKGIGKDDIVLGQCRSRNLATKRCHHWINWFKNQSTKNGYPESIRAVLNHHLKRYPDSKIWYFETKNDWCDKTDQLDFVVAKMNKSYRNKRARDKKRQTGTESMTTSLATAATAAPAFLCDTEYIPFNEDTDDTDDGPFTGDDGDDSDNVASGEDDDAMTTEFAEVENEAVVHGTDQDGMATADRVEEDAKLATTSPGAADPPTIGLEEVMEDLDVSAMSSEFGKLGMNESSMMACEHMPAVDDDNNKSADVGGSVASINRTSQSGGGDDNDQFNDQFAMISDHDLAAIKIPPPSKSVCGGDDPDNDQFAMIADHDLATMEIPVPATRIPGAPAKLAGAADLVAATAADNGTNSSSNFPDTDSFGEDACLAAAAATAHDDDECVGTGTAAVAVGSGSGVGTSTTACSAAAAGAAGGGGHAGPVAGFGNTGTRDSRWDFPSLHAMLSAKVDPDDMDVDAAIKMVVRYMQANYTGECEDQVCEIVAIQTVESWRTEQQKRWQSVPHRRSKSTTTPAKASGTETMEPTPRKQTTPKTVNEAAAAAMPAVPGETTKKKRQRSPQKQKSMPIAKWLATGAEHSTDTKKPAPRVQKKSPPPPSPTKKKSVKTARRKRSRKATTPKTKESPNTKEKEKPPCAIIKALLEVQKLRQQKQQNTETKLKQTQLDFGQKPRPKSLKEAYPIPSVAEVLATAAAIRDEDVEDPFVTKFECKNGSRGGVLEITPTKECLTKMMDALLEAEAGLSQRKKDDVRCVLTAKYDKEKWDCSTLERDIEDVHRLIVQNQEDHHRDILSGARTAVNSKLLEQDLKAGKRSRAFVKQAKNLVKKLKKCTKELFAMDDFSPPRNGWEWIGRNEFQLCVAAILSAGTLDERLFYVCMALRGLGWLNIAFLSERRHYWWIKAVFNYVGLNYFTDQAANVCAFAYRLKKEHNGKIPASDGDRRRVLLTFYGIGRKIYSLISHDVYKIRYETITMDIHVANTCINLEGWTKQTDAKNAADQIAKEVECWLPPEYYYDLNVVFAGIRQLWEHSKSNRQMIMKVAKEHKCEDDVLAICKDLTSYKEG